MVDLHSHILPGVDDGAPDIEASIAMARTAAADGIRVMVATPHISFEYELDPADVGRLVGELNLALAREEVPLAVLPGGEIALTRLAALDAPALRTLSLGVGPYLLVETPYAGGAPFLEEVLFDLDLRGFRTILAHPERCAMFEHDRDRLARLVERGVLCSVNAGSMAGQFGRRVRDFAVHLFRAGLVHNVASDAHDDDVRRAELRWGFERMEDDLPGISEQAQWFTDIAPTAIVTGTQVPPPPEPPQPKRAWRRMRRSG
ncbi:MAG TPA: CpsB/CapC family capsule biosynthesis tyrosine phosphatase [Thermoleophilaceae bacterium]|nr:CpsB/CapC family capsule biosynthesis tyrosine phosphatase [Thermoleophilaceae bacterium]